jgi:ubiquitin
VDGFGRRNKNLISNHLTSHITPPVACGQSKECRAEIGTRNNAARLCFCL